jgi:hypothetical protein
MAWPRRLRTWYCSPILLTVRSGVVGRFGAFLTGDVAPALAPPAPVSLAMLAAEVAVGRRCSGEPLGVCLSPSCGVPVFSGE